MANEDKKIVSVEGLKKVREKLDQKYVIEGEYSPNTSVGLSRLAENLTPYSSESGTEQDIPFILQGTGCGNGATQVDTGSYAQITAKKGNVVVANQLVNTGDTEVATESGRKYWTWINNTYAIVTSTGLSIAINDDSVDKVVDLTLMHGNNAWIPSDLLSHPENFYRYYQGSLAYDTGSFVHANGRYIVTTGRNQWNEEWESGSINTTTGQNAINPDKIRSKNYIRIVPNRYYYFKSNKILDVSFYDVNQNFISYRPLQNEYSKTPSNAQYIRFSLGATTYNHDITLSLYYSGESGYNEYYPYEELDNIDTGTEELLQAGEASDTKTKDGTITHNLVEINLSEKNWTLVEESGYWYFVGSSPSNIRSVGSANLPNAHSDKYVTVKMNDAGLANNTFAIDNQFILVRTSSTSVTPTGTIIAELDEPTTEQGTPYESTLNINDFGAMYWLTSDNATPSVPQGIEIFYPVDYKAFVDTLYNHTDGDATNLVVQSDLATSESVRDNIDTQLKNALGGTLRQCLCVKASLDFNNTAFVDLGDLNWNKDVGETTFYSTDLQALMAIPTTQSDIANIITTKFNTMSYTDWLVDKPDMSTFVTTLGYLRIRYDAVNTPTNFKTAMKGVLLAYEKA